MKEYLSYLLPSLNIGGTILLINGLKNNNLSTLVLAAICISVSLMALISRIESLERKQNKINNSTK
jgi:hypothetical protein